jgi:AT-binding transcription factor 1
MTATSGFGQPQDLEQSMRKYYEDTMKRYMDDLQGSRSDQSLRQSETPPSSSSAQIRQQALDLTTPPPPKTPNCNPALDLSGARDNHENDNDSSYWDKSGADDQSICSENNNEFEESMSHQGDGAIQSPSSPLMVGQNKHESSDSGSLGNKRFRTQMSGVQIKIMKSVFHIYKTPTMSECASLGREIGLQKRVVQVWFQNARAKEKKARLQLHQMTGREPEMPPTPTDCHICGHKYSHNLAVQEHIFERSHLDNVRVAIEQGRYEPPAPGEALNQAIAALQPAGTESSRYSSSPPPQSTSSSAAAGNSQLQILQMAAQGICLPQPPPEGAIPVDPGTSAGQEDVGVEHREKMEKALMQLYGMGHGITSYPTGVATANPFLHPAMFSTSGKSFFVSIVEKLKV